MNETATPTAARSYCLARLELRLLITHERNQNRVGGRAQAGPQPYRRPVACARSAGVALADALLIALPRYSPGGEYDGNEYGGLPVDYSVFLITRAATYFSFERRADNACQNSDAVDSSGDRLGGPTPS